MGDNYKMWPPYYILINDKDFEHLKFYHDYNYKNIHYENEFGDHSAETEVYTKNILAQFILGLEECAI